MSKFVEQLKPQRTAASGAGAPGATTRAGSWRRGLNPLGGDDLEDLAEATLQASSERLDFSQFDPDAAGRAEDRVRPILREALDKVSTEQDFQASEADRAALVDQLFRELSGYGPIETFLADPTVSEIMANGADQLIVERSGALVRTRRKFRSNDHLLMIARFMASRLGRKVDEETPHVDSRLPDGSRVHAIVPPLAPDGPSITIRKFSRSATTMADLVSHGAVPQAVADFLHACVRGRLNIVVAGGTNTGKTTMLNALAEAITEGERVITIEDACELRLDRWNLVRLETRPPDLEGAGEVSIRSLLRNALRMRPDRILVGEVRGAECFDMLQAMNTGHVGSMTTVHANSARETLTRIESTFLLSGIELPLAAMRRNISTAINLLVYLERTPAGARRIAQISEVVGMEGDVITTQDLFETKEDRLTPTGLVPLAAEILEKRGMQLPTGLFAENAGRRGGRS